jgi:hypothetical protein
MRRRMIDGYKDALREAGVRNLKAFGYPHVTADNVTTDKVYLRFFDSMLSDHKPRTDEERQAIKELRAKMAPPTPPAESER